jgi:diguanylate cyclase (GGDEF)-like protein
MRYHMKDIGERLSDLYTLITVIIIAISIFHALFAIILYHMIIRPIHILYQGSGEIAVGNFDIRVDINHRDELGALGESFNIMAESVQDKIYTLEDQMKIISEAKEKIEEMAITDDLTGLNNRRYLFEQLEREIERSLRYGHPLGFIMVDADHFKNINDTHGHYIGDIVLKEIAALIKENCREIDTAARYGGEEFAIIALSADTETTFVMAERIRKSVEEKPIRCDDVEINLTVSIGLISYRQEDLEKMAHIDEMVNAADKALYRAKQNGRNRTEIFSNDKPA